MFIMKKTVSLSMIMLLLLLCGCKADEVNNTQTRVLLDTVVKLTADCDEDTLSGAFDLCSQYEDKLSRTKSGSDVSLLNGSGGAVTVSDCTVEIIEKSVYYSDLTNGLFDITVCPVSELWDFKNQVIPSRDEIAEALKNVDYHSIEINGNSVNLNGKKIDLGGIAKGYIADRVKEYLVENGASSGIINLGGNVIVFGGKYKVGIQKPFSEDLAATVELCDKSAVTSGVYQRYIEKDGEIYHHIIDPRTGYGVKSGLYSVTVLGDSSFDCDALSTSCLLLGLDGGMSLIEKTPNTEAVFIDEIGKMYVSSGLYIKGKRIAYK